METNEAVEAMAVMDRLQAAIVEVGKLAEKDTVWLEELNVQAMNTEVLARLLIANLPVPEIPMPMHMKTYWMEMAEALGPDWIASMDKAVNWMKRVDNFV